MTGVAARILEFENALAVALNRGDFQVICVDGERYLVPIIRDHGMDLSIHFFPRTSLYSVALDLERLLS